MQRRNHRVTFRLISNPRQSSIQETPTPDDRKITSQAAYEIAVGGWYLQWLAADEIRPPPDLRGDTLLARQLFAHAAGEECSCLSFTISSDLGNFPGRLLLTLGSMNSGTPKSTAFLRIT